MDLNYCKYKQVHTIKLITRSTNISVGKEVNLYTPILRAVLCPKNFKVYLLAEPHTQRLKVELH